MELECENGCQDNSIRDDDAVMPADGNMDMVRVQPLPILNDVQPLPILSAGVSLGITQPPMDATWQDVADLDFPAQHSPIAIQSSARKGIGHLKNEYFSAMQSVDFDVPPQVIVERLGRGGRIALNPVGTISEKQPPKAVLKSRSKNSMQQILVGLLPN